MDKNFSNITELNLLDVPIPLSTDSYSPVSHGNIINAVQEQLDRNNLTITNKEYRSNSKGTQVIGIFDIHSSHNELGFRLGFKNSYDKSMSLALVAGSQVWICGNGMISGEIQFVRKHTGTVLTELRDKIIYSINQLEESFNLHLIDKSNMEQIELSDNGRNALLGKLFFDTNLIKPHQTAIIKKELTDSEYPTFSNNNLWGVYNKVTHAFKQSHPSNYIEDHKKLHQIVMEEYS